MNKDELTIEEHAAKLKTAIRKLMAIIHRDGGHHTMKVGLLQSIKDATEVVLASRQAIAKQRRIEVDLAISKACPQDKGYQFSCLRCPLSQENNASNDNKMYCEVDEREIDQSVEQIPD